MIHKTRFFLKRWFFPVELLEWCNSKGFWEGWWLFSFSYSNSRF